jgi:hypothetical protein
MKLILSTLTLVMFGIGAGIAGAADPMSDKESNPTLGASSPDGQRDSRSLKTGTSSAESSGKMQRETDPLSGGALAPDSMGQSRREQGSGDSLGSRQQDSSTRGNSGSSTSNTGSSSTSGASGMSGSGTSGH